MEKYVEVNHDEILALHRVDRKRAGISLAVKVEVCVVRHRDGMLGACR